MALSAYLRLKGQKQGLIYGSVTQKGREGWMEIIAVNHTIVSPRDTASGLPTGKRQHKPLVITKLWDKSTPMLFNALCNNENIPELSVQFWTPQLAASTGMGAEKQHYTIDLTNANIAAINVLMPNNKNPSHGELPQMEEIHFIYQKIAFSWVDGGITAMDDWEAPVS